MACTGLLQKIKIAGSANMMMKAVDSAKASYIHPAHFLKSSFQPKEAMMIMEGQTNNMCRAPL